MPLNVAMSLSPAEQLESILSRHRFDASRLLQILIEIQDRLGHLPKPVALELAQRLDIPLARIESVASFYAFLHTQPHGDYRVLFSDNITDRMQGSAELMQQLCRLLWVEPGKVSEDGLVGVGATSCIGLSDQGPSLLLNGRPITRLTPQRIQEIGLLIRNRTPLDDWPAELFQVEDIIRRSGPLLDNTRQPGEVLKAALTLSVRAERSGQSPRSRSPHEPPPFDSATLRSGRTEVIETLKASGLRGRGGAGFPTGLKWESTLNAAGAAKYVVCNADEGEPGTFKDRVLLSRQADLLFEGMTLCALSIGAQQGFLYLRGEYRFLREHLDVVLQRRRKAGLLGTAILGQAGFDFDIEIHLGAGAYICGEETALLESLEGKRGVPRNRPPFPVAHGYKQQPTVVDNVETFCQAAIALHMGAENYKTIGTPQSSGSKLHAVSGDCARPGVYEYPFGVTVRQLLADCGAEDAQAVQVGGPSGVCLAAHEFDHRLCFEDLPTAGAFMVFGPQRDLFEVARNFAHFFAHESCGFCTPCRAGTTLLKQTMDKIAAGHGTRYDLREVEKLDRVLQTASHCGLGRSACNPVLHTLKHFRPAYERKLKSLDFEPAFDLDGALARARLMTGRDDAGAHLKTEET